MKPASMASSPCRNRTVSVAAMARACRQVGKQKTIDRSLPRYRIPSSASVSSLSASTSSVAQHRDLRRRSTGTVLADVPVRTDDPVAGDRGTAMGCRRAPSPRRAPRGVDRSPGRPRSTGGPLPTGSPSSCARWRHRMRVSDDRSSGRSGCHSPASWRAMAAARSAGIRSTRVTGRPVRSITSSSNPAASPARSTTHDAGATPGNEERPDGAIDLGPRIDVTHHPMSASYRSRNPSPSGSRSSTTNV